MHCLALLLLLVATAQPSSTGARAEAVRRHVAPGVEFAQEAVTGADGPLLVNVLTVDLKQPGVRVETALGHDGAASDDPARGRETVGALVARRGAVAGVNADFFPFTGDPLNLAIRGGELLSESWPRRPVLGLDAGGQWLIDCVSTTGTLSAGGATLALGGINRAAKKNEAVVYTPTAVTTGRDGSAEAGLPVAGVNLPLKVGQDQEGTAGQPLPCAARTSVPAGSLLVAGNGTAAEWLRTHVKPGDHVSVRFDLAAAGTAPEPARGELASRASTGRGAVGAWSGVTQAVGGGCWLVRDGLAAVDGVAAGFSLREFVNARHPRTAAGVTADGQLLLVTVDGRQPHSRGVTLDEMARLMLRLGATRAINLDGGGSTTLVVGGLYVNGPSDGEPRPVADALLVFSDAPARPAPVTAEPVTFQAGQSVQLPAPPSGGAFLYGTLDGRGFVDQRGLLTATHAGKGQAVVDAGTERRVTPFTVVPGPPTKLRASLMAAANNPPDRSLVAVVMTDAFGNGVAGQTVQLQVKGGQAERTSVATDADGRATVEVVWDVEKGRQVAVSSGSLPPVTIKR